MHFLWQSLLLWLSYGLGVFAATPEADNKKIKSIPVDPAIHVCAVALADNEYPSCEHIVFLLSVIPTIICCIASMTYAVVSPSTTDRLWIAVLGH